MSTLALQTASHSTPAYNEIYYIMWLSIWWGPFSSTI